MIVEVLFFQGCPHSAATMRLVRDVVQALGVVVDVREVEVTSPEEAIRLRFLGSPTVQVNGKDIEAARRADGDYTMSCRMYRSAGVPPRKMIEESLAREIA